MEINIDEILISLAKKQIIIEKQEAAIQLLTAKYNELILKYDLLESELRETENG